MDYTFSKTLETDFDNAIAKITSALKEIGFGIVSEIDLKNTFKQKLDVDFNPYKILGACSPSFAHQALQLEPKVGAMMPCNVIVRQIAEGTVEVSAVDPVVSLKGIEHQELHEMLAEVRELLKKTIKEL